MLARNVQETAKLESEAFVQRQKVALASEVKAVLDSWVRFEQQAKESEQADLVKAVVENVLKNLNNEKTQKEILAGAVAEIERAYSLPPGFAIQWFGLTDVRSLRARQEQGYLSNCSEHVVPFVDQLNGLRALYATHHNLLRWPWTTTANYNITSGVPSSIRIQLVSRWS